MGKESEKGKAESDVCVDPGHLAWCYDRNKAGCWHTVYQWWKLESLLGWISFRSLTEPCVIPGCLWKTGCWSLFLLAPGCGSSPVHIFLSVQIWPRTISSSISQTMDTREADVFNYILQVSGKWKKWLTVVASSAFSGIPENTKLSLMLPAWNLMTVSLIFFLFFWELGHSFN